VNDLSNTQKLSFRGKDLQRLDAHDVVMRVSEALYVKGYDPVVQIVGYLLSGDPTYITSHNGARSLISRLERDELLEIFVDYYLRGNME